MLRKETESGSESAKEGEKVRKLTNQASFYIAGACLNEIAVDGPQTRPRLMKRAALGSENS